jgi:hypothetical protein
MSPKALLVLVLLAVGVGAGAYLATRDQGDVGQTSRGRLAFADLPAQAESAQRIVLRQGDKSVTLARDGQGWGIVEKGNYPAEIEKLRALFAGLAELRLSEPRTGVSDEYARLGVEDPTKKGAGGTLIQIFGKQDTQILALIVGHRREARGASGGGELYVRVPTEAQSWLADGRLEASADVSSWFGHDLLNISRDRIKSVEVARDGGDLSFTVASGKASLVRPADHGALDPSKLDDVARGLEYLTLSDVTATAKQPGKVLADTVFQTKNGLGVTAHVTQDDKNTWVSLVFSGTGEAVAEAKSLTAAHGGWAFHVGDWKRAALAPELKDLLAPVPKTAAPDKGEDKEAAPAK